MKKKIQVQANKAVKELTDVFDRMHEHMVAMENAGRHDQVQFLNQQTIMNCSNMVSNQDMFEVEEKAKAKLLTRLVREYRRTIEHQQKAMVAEQNDRKIELKMKSRFPHLIANRQENKQEEPTLKQQMMRYYQEVDMS